MPFWEHMPFASNWADAICRLATADPWYRSNQLTLCSARFPLWLLSPLSDHSRGRISVRAVGGASMKVRWDSLRMAQKDELQFSVAAALAW